MFAVIFFGGSLFLRIPGKIANIANISTRKNCVPHGKGNLVTYLAEGIFYTYRLRYYYSESCKETR